MNRIAVQTGGPEERLGVDETYRKVKEWGFDAVDANIDHLLGYSAIAHNEIPEVLVRGGRDCMELFKPWKEGAEETGLENYQAHAPFPSCKAGNALVNAQMIEVLKNTIRACDYIRCRNLIVHPFVFGYDNRLSDQDEWDYNIERYSQLIPVAKEYGVTVCLENMFSAFKGKMYASCCSEMQTAARYVDELNRIAGSETFGFCLDTGHA
ncbi:MAG: sugar phosphate isomerase/epimerase, partial [Clostridia bacterium]|nr:sugar phosphate isomerase/epimerase [Clostridia bacterium]